MLWWTLRQLRSRNPYSRLTAVERLGNDKDVRAVKPLVAALSDADWLVRKNAARALGEIGDVLAVEPLIALLGDDDNSSCRAAAAEALGKIGDARAVEHLVSALQNPSHLEGVAVSGALAALGWKPKSARERVLQAVAASDYDAASVEGSVAVDLLLAVVNAHAHSERSIPVVKALGKIKDPQTVRPLTTLLRVSSSDGLRQAVVEALGNIGQGAVVKAQPPALALDIPTEIAKLIFDDPRGEAVEALVAALWDRNENVRMAAAEALGQIIDERAINGLVAALNYGVGEFGQAVTDALVRLGPATVRSLMMVFKGYKYDEEQRHAAEVLRRVGPVALELTIAGLTDPEADVRISAARVIEKLRHPEAVDALLNALEDEHWPVRAEAATALAAMGDKRAVTRLIGLLNDGDLVVRIAAAKTLGTLADGRAIEPLVNAAHRQGSSRPNHALEALGKIGDTNAVNALIELAGNVTLAAEAISALIHALRTRSCHIASEALRAVGGHVNKCVNKLRRLFPPLLGPNCVSR